MLAQLLIAQTIHFLGSSSKAKINMRLIVQRTIKLSHAGIFQNLQQTQIYIVQENRMNDIQCKYLWKKLISCRWITTRICKVFYIIRTATIGKSKLPQLKSEFLHFTLLCQWKITAWKIKPPSSNRSLFFFVRLQWQQVLIFYASLCIRNGGLKRGDQLLSVNGVVSTLTTKDVRQYVKTLEWTCL